MIAKHINLQNFTSSQLQVNNIVYLNGYVYTARDAAHKRLQEMHKAGKALPIEISKSVIYYVGACPCKPTDIIGSCGPTTSSRMDFFTPTLIQLGLAAVIGKGKRNSEVQRAFEDSSATYFTAFGGAGAYYADCVKSQELICFPDLLSEAIYKLEIQNFPAVVSIIGCK